MSSDLTPPEGNRIVLGVNALKVMAEEQGNFIDASRLSLDDLHFLADLPLNGALTRFTGKEMTVEQANRLRRLLDRATARAILTMSAAHQTNTHQRAA